MNIVKNWHPDKVPEAVEYFTAVNKAYETLIDDHKRAAYDEDQLTDKEFFSIQVGPMKVNLFLVFGLSVASFIGTVLYMKFANTKKNDCPIDHDHQKYAKKMYRRERRSNQE